MATVPERNRRRDAVDERILTELVRNARVSFRDLGDAVGLSANAVAQRVRRLQQEGTIRAFTAILDPGAAADRPALVALVEVRTTPTADPATLEAAFAALPEVVEVLDLAGRADYQLRVRVPSTEALHAVVQRIRALPGVVATDTRTVLRTVLSR